VLDHCACDWSIAEHAHGASTLQQRIESRRARKHFCPAHILEVPQWNELWWSAHPSNLPCMVEPPQRFTN
jgi:hypothetical protein